MIVKQMIRNGLLALVAALSVAGVAKAQTASTNKANVPQGDALKATHGAWEVRCGQNGGCYMIQTLKNDKGDPTVVAVIRKTQPTQSKDGKNIVAVGEFIVPLDVYLPAGLGMKIDNADYQAAPYQRCLPIGCIVFAPMTDELIGQLKSGKVATFALLRRPGDKPVEKAASLAGFSAAFGAL